MIVLHPNTTQYNALNYYRYNSSELLFVKDGSNKWIVGVEVLNDPNFVEIHDALTKLKRITYTPFADEDN